MASHRSCRPEEGPVGLVSFRLFIRNSLKDMKHHEAILVYRSLVSGMEDDRAGGSGLVVFIHIHTRCNPHSATLPMFSRSRNSPSLPSRLGGFARIRTHLAEGQLVIQLNLQSVMSSHFHPLILLAIDQSTKHHGPVL